MASPSDGDLRPPSTAATTDDASGPARVALPALRAMVDAQTPAFHAASAATGKPVTCRRGCAACCRQIIPVSDVEAHALTRLVAAMPGERRERVEARFAAAERRLLEWRPIERLMPLEPLTEGDHRLRAREYFGLSLDCPFLEDESCSIYADRPMVCREYDVVSPPSECGRLAEGARPVAIVRPPVGEALELLTSAEEPPRRVTMPLVLAPRWAAARPDEGVELPVVEWLRRVADRHDRLLAERRAVRREPPAARPTLTAAEGPPAAPPAAAPTGMRVTVPDDPGPARGILPALRQMVDRNSRDVAAAAAARGTPVSCGPKCGACCRQIVPVSDVEARALAELVASFPEERRARVTARFTEAEQRLAAWRPVDELAPLAMLPDDAHRRRSIDYYRLGLACPFLEDESCSIHADRPLICREFDVISHPSVCARMGEGLLPDALVRPMLSDALEFLTSDEEPPRRTRLALPLALRWAAENPAGEAPRTGVEWFQRFMALNRATPAGGAGATRTDAPAPGPPSPPPAPGVKVSVPDGDIPARAILPAVRRIVDANTAAAAAAAEACGEAVSCKIGCAACCRQAVPLSDIEAREVAAIVEALPEPRRTAVRSRFDAAVARLAAWRPLDTLMDWDPGTGRDAYFDLALPCPFLEDERCSIYELRPLACREFMVTSPPEMCFDAAKRQDVRGVPRQFMEPGLRFLSSYDEPSPRRTTILLPLALRWSAAAPAEPLRTGADWFERLGATLRSLGGGRRVDDTDRPPPPAMPVIGPLEMDAAVSAGAMKATLNLSVSGQRVDVDVAIPTGIVPHGAIVPIAQAVTNAIVATASDASAARGAPVSCRAGCAACCRQVAPVSTAEAHRLAAVVAAMPEPLQGRVRARFAEVERRTEALGMLERLFHLEKAYPDTAVEFGLRYFAERIDCPFLIDERCAIHAERPLTCREYVVTSPAENCWDLERATVDIVQAPRLSASLRRLGAPGDGAPPAIAVSVALAWVERNPEPPPPRPGPEWFHALFERVMARQGPDGESTG